MAVFEKSEYLERIERTKERMVRQASKYLS